MTRGPADAGESLARLLTRVARGGDEAEDAVQEIVARHAGPQIEELLAYAIRRRMVPASEAADLGHDVVLRLLVKLRQLAVDRTSEPITLFPNYVGAVFRHCLVDRRRLLDPERTKLALRIRYTLTHTPALALWGHDPILCGLADWAGRRSWGPPPPVTRLEAPPGDDAHGLRRLIEDLLRRAGAPVELWQLVDTVATAHGLTEDRFLDSGALREVVAPPEVADSLESRQYLSQLWDEIEQLPLNQRWALLLNLRLETGDSIARALAALRIAGMRRIAAALELPLDELLAMWDQLPLPDTRIGEMLGLARQQVINLRKAARDRLGRRLDRRRKKRGGA
jgi:DNA-directed RNA polymerase specialized sigma24 family protein